MKNYTNIITVCACARVTAHDQLAKKERSDCNFAELPHTHSTDATRNPNEIKHHQTGVDS